MLYFHGLVKYIICEMCGVNETDNADGICDDCAASIILNDNIVPNEEDFI